MERYYQDILLSLAREAIESSLTGGPMPLFEQLKCEEKPVFQREQGCFVTLATKKGELRGCIGNLWGKGPLWQEIPALARQSAFSDPRFHPVEKEELNNLVIEISLLTTMELLEDWHQIRLGIDGVLLAHGYHRAVFLPQVPVQQGWDLPTMLTQLSLKAGLWQDAYTDSACTFEVFQAEVFSEEVP